MILDERNARGVTMLCNMLYTENTCDTVNLSSKTFDSFVCVYSKLITLVTYSDNSSDMRDKMNIEMEISLIIHHSFCQQFW